MHKIPFATAFRQSFAFHRSRDGWVRAAGRMMTVAAVVLTPSDLRHLGRRNFYLGVLGANRDPFAFLTHGRYLSANFSRRDRVQAWIDHYEHESRSCVAGVSSLGHLTDEILLWSGPETDATEIWLGRSSQRNNEGELTIYLRHRELVLHRISYSWIRVSLLVQDASQQGETTVPFITRNQAVNADGLASFVKQFPQHSPVYFCIAALCGVCQAFGEEAVYAISHRSQIAYEERYDKGFQNSYSLLWQKLGGEQEGLGWRIRMPLLSLPDDPTISGNARRTRRRRLLWASIRESARETAIRSWVALADG